MYVEDDISSLREIQQDIENNAARYCCGLFV